MAKTRIVRNEEHEGETSIQRDPNAHNVNDVVSTMNQMLTTMVSMQESQKSMMEAITALQQEMRPQTYRRPTPPIIHIDANPNEEPPLGAATPGGDGNDGEEVIADQGASATKEKQSAGPSNDPTHSNPQTVVTLKDVENLIMRSKSLPTMPSFDLRPPYPLELASKPYPRDYVNIKFPKYNGKDGNAREHISRFVDALGVFGADKNLALREFSKSLTERAYTWYNNLAPGTVKSWEQMANLFYTKFFDTDERVTLIDLGKERQGVREQLNDYVKRFREKALECIDPVAEDKLVEMCISGMTDEYRAHLENLGIESFARLFLAARRTGASVKPLLHHDRWTTSKRSHIVAAAETRTAYQVDNTQANKRKLRDEPPMFPCSMDKVHIIFDQMLKDGILILPNVSREPTLEEKKSKSYCRYHRTTRHPTEQCWSLRRFFHKKMGAGEIILTEEGNKDVNTQPFPAHDKGKAHAHMTSHNATNARPFMKKFKGGEIIPFSHKRTWECNSKKKNEIYVERLHDQHAYWFERLGACQTQSPLHVGWNSDFNEHQKFHAPSSSAYRRDQSYDISHSNELDPLAIGTFDDNICERAET